MTLREKWIAAAAVVLLIVLALAVREWFDEHDARVKAEATQTAQKQVIDSAQKSIDAAKADQAKIAEGLEQQLAALEAQKRQPVTPAQFVMDMSKVLPNLPQPVTIQTPIPAAEGKGPSQPPSAAEQQIVIPAADLPALQAYKLDCDETSAKLGACQLTGANLQTQLDGTQTQLRATAAERDSWKTAAKGGSFLHRLGKSVKCLAIGSGLSAAGAWADKNQPARGAAIGAVAGGVGCELF